MSARYGRRLGPDQIDGAVSVSDLVDHYFLAFNAARLREACHLFVQRIIASDVVVCLTLSGALTPTGLGSAAVAPLIEAGFVDWIVSTGANIYHDLHRSLGFDLYGINPSVNDVHLREQRLIRIYDIVFEQNVLLQSDAFLRKLIGGPEFQHRMSTAEFHALLGKYVKERERVLGIRNKSLLTAAYEAGVPIFTSSPGDSSIGMNIAAERLAGNNLSIDPEQDVNDSTAIVYYAKKNGLKSAIVILGGGSPKNFALQTEPQLQEIMGISEEGHDFYLQITDSRADTGGLSGATPSESITWGKLKPEQLPDAVVCYCDTTIALPILTAYALANAKPRPVRNLYSLLGEFHHALEQAYTSRPRLSA